MNLKSAHPACLALLLAATVANGAETRPPSGDEDYLKIVNQRAEKIVSTLGLKDATQAGRVQALIAGQYRALSAIHDQRDAQIKAAKATNGATKESVNIATETAREKTQKQVAQLHQQYLERLGQELTPAQIDQVKDGMTYGVVAITYKAYLQMLPALTEAQKARVMTELVAAREIAMDAGTAEEKHQVFGKFKGRINNYLAAQGYDLKEASKRLQNK